MFVEPAISTSDIASGLRDELKRLRKRRQLAPFDHAHAGASSSSARTVASGSPRVIATAVHRRSPAASPEPMDDAAALRMASGILAGQQQQQSHGKADTKPLFTLKQMTMICERMCKVGTK